MDSDLIVQAILNAVVDPKLNFDQKNEDLRKLAIYINQKYQPERKYIEELIMYKLFELQHYLDVNLNNELIDKSIDNYKSTKHDFQKDLQTFIISKKIIDGIEEYSSDLLAFSEL